MSQYVPKSQDFQIFFEVKRNTVSCSSFYSKALELTKLEVTSIRSNVKGKASLAKKLRWPSGKSVRLGSCRLELDSKSNKKCFELKTSFE